MGQDYKRRFGDRPDGRLCRNKEPFFAVIPQIMRSRVDSQVMFEEKIEITHLEKYIRAKRKEDIPNLSILHFIMAAIIRMFVEYPGLNRFVAGKRIFARNHYRASIAIKRNMTIDGEETTIMPEFEATDTLKDVTEKLNKLIFDNKDEDGDDNNTDDVVNVLKKTPVWLVNFIVWLLRNLDKRGLCPKIIREASPFHGSFFLTDVASLGIGSIYHHLYEFGTVSVFVAIGKRETVNEVQDDGTIIKRKYLSIKMNLDERICDGFYYAAAFKSFKRLFKKPELLEMPPENIPEDPWI
jgi:hypothetical protein